jgi:hypothetical protein
MVLVGAIAYRRVSSASIENRGAGSSPTLTLPFTIPCAVDSHDAAPVYAAFRRRDRELLEKLFADKKFVAVPEGLAVRISGFGRTSMVTIGARSGRRPGVCFVPTYVVAVIRQHAPRQ